jgi:membrane-associated phospholipid phosphatase
MSQKNTTIPQGRFFTNVWFIAGSVFCMLFLVYSGIYASGVLNIQTLEIERALLLRPVTRVDCMFYEWRHLGEVPVSLVITLILGSICILSGFRRRVVLFLLLLLLVGGGVELVGKKALALPLPPTLRSGMTVLECPQLSHTTFAEHLIAGTAQWSKIPEPPQVQVSWAREVATMPFVFEAGASENSFPGGHAMRWMFLGLVEGWLCWRLIRNRLLRTFLLLLCCLFSFAGGLMQFYIGVHFITDTISGWLFGAALACYAITLLTRNDTRRVQALQRGPMPDTSAIIGTDTDTLQGEHSFSAYQGRVR